MSSNAMPAVVTQNGGAYLQALQLPLRGCMSEADAMENLRRHLYRFAKV